MNLAYMNNLKTVAIDVKRSLSALYCNVLFLKASTCITFIHLYHTVPVSWVHSQVLLLSSYHIWSGGDDSCTTHVHVATLLRVRTVSALCFCLKVCTVCPM